MAAPSYSAAYRMSGESSGYGHIGKSPSLGHVKRFSPLSRLVGSLLFL